MRTLKKTLSLVLVVCMVLSFGAIGAGAAFTDTADVEYDEAIAVMTGIGVINGMTDTTFEPDSGLTREQAAKIISYMLLGPTNAQLIGSASTQKFADVATNRWSAGYIEYIANLGIIAGVGNDNFDPTGVLTTCAFSKMLLCALGYDASVEEYTGASWAINVAADAVDAGIAQNGIVLSASVPITREQACQLALLTLKARTVQYSGGTSIVTGDTTITIGATRSYIANNATTETIKSDDFMQFAESRFPKLTYTSTTSDKFGRPSYTWKNGTTKIGTYTTTAAVAVWTEDLTAATNSTVKNALADYTFEATTDLYINGVNTTPAMTSASVKALTANGTAVEVYADSDNVITSVVVIATVLGTVTNKDVDAKTVTVSDGTNDVILTDDSAAASFGNAYDVLYAMDVNDKVLLVSTAAAGDITAILSVEEPTTAAGKYTSLKSGVYTVGDATYKLSANGTAPGTLGTVYTLTLDTYGYIIAVGEGTTNDTYAFMLDGVKEGSVMSGYTYYAKLLFVDGTVSWVEMTSIDGKTAAADLDTAIAIENKFVSYTVASDAYAISAVAAGLQETTASTITKNSASYDGHIVTNTTVFLIYNSGTKTYAAYTGIKNVPTTTVTTGYALENSSETSYKIVVVASPTATASNDRVYIYDGANKGASLNGSATVYTFNAIVNGAKTTVDVLAAETTAGALTAGLYIGNTYTNGYISDLGTDTSKNIAATTVIDDGDDNDVLEFTTAIGEKISLADGIIFVDGVTIDVSGVVAEGFTCFYVDGTSCSTKTLSSTEFAFTAIGNVFFAIDDSGYVSYAIIVD